MLRYNAGKISIEYVTIFLSKYISKDAVDLKFLSDVNYNPSNPYIQRKQNKLCNKNGVKQGEITEQLCLMLCRKVMPASRRLLQEKLFAYVDQI